METTSPSQPWAAESRFRMIDVGAKAVTERRAVAQGRVFLSREAFEAIRTKTNPKGDVLALAEAAGVITAKKTAEIIPLCHPLPLDQVRLSFQLRGEDASVLVECEAKATAKTGVEMEALAGVQGALLTIYDLSKAVNPEITLGEIRLNLKEGGKSGKWIHPQAAAPVAPQAGEKLRLEGVRVGVITISDRCSQKLAEDISGPKLADGLKKEGAEILAHLTVPDDRIEIQRAVQQLALEMRAALVLTTGGTGLSPRDVTPEALDELYEKRVPGLGELLRAEGARSTRMSWISRGEAGVLGSTLIIPLPGSTGAVDDGLKTLMSLLPHAMKILKGGQH